jgi:trinucleotide repeat-containing gene 6 protein
MPFETQAKSDPNNAASASHSAKAESNLLSPHTTNIKLNGPCGALSSSQDKHSLSHNIPQVDEWWYKPASNAGWGIPRGLGLRGGGESSLNSGTAGWGTPPSASSSNNAGGWGQNAPAQNSNPNQGQWGSAPRPGNNNQGPTGPPNAGIVKSCKAIPQYFSDCIMVMGMYDFTVKGSQSPQGQQQSTSASGGQQSGGGQQPSSQTPNQQASQSGNGSGSGQQQPPQNGSPSWAQAAGGAGGGGPGKGPGQPPGPNGGGSSSAKQLEQLNSMREALFSQDGWGGVS